MLRVLKEYHKSNRSAKFFILLFLLIFLYGCSDIKDPPQTMEEINLTKYMGRWYEIASFPNSFQRHCRCTSADYELQDGNVKITNSCVQDGRGRVAASGRGWVVAGSHNAKLKVQFTWPFTGDYWILYVSPQYEYAIVGTPDRQYLWLLARKPVIDMKIYDELVLIARQRGYVINKLIKTIQNCPLIKN